MIIERNLRNYETEGTVTNKSNESAVISIFYVQLIIT